MPATHIALAGGLGLIFTVMRCPTCNAVVDPQHSPALPFCSERCQQIDLARWLNEDHGLPVVPDPDADELPEPNAWDEDDD